AATSCDRRLLRRTHGQFRGRIAWLPPGRLAQSRVSSSATFGSVTPEGRGPTKQVRARFAISGSEPLAKQCTCRELRYDRERGSDDGDCARKDQGPGGAVQQPR